MKSTYLKRTLSAFALFSALSLIVFSFQNCGKGFESISGEVSLSSITPPDSTPVALPYSVSGEDSGRIFTEQTSETYQESVTIVDDLEKGRVFQVAGSLNLTSFGRGAIDTTRIYRISGELKSIGQTPSLVYLGLMPLDEDLEFIQPWHVLRQGNPTRIASIGEGLGGQIEIQTTEELSGWNAATVPGYHRMIGFYLDGDTTKRPDYIHTGIITALTSPQVGAYSSLSGNTIVLNGALPEGFMEELLQSPEAVILNHFSGGTYIYTAAAAVSVGTEWTRFEGLITDEQFNNTNNQFRPDTKWAKISLLANYQQDESAQLQFTNLRLEEVSRDSLDITLVQGLQNQTVPQGQNVTLTATFNGPVDRYTWLRDGNVVAGQNTNTLILTNAQANQSGVYTLRAESFTTSIETSATITIVAPPALATAVGNRIVQELGNITLSAQFTGMGLTYQWFKNNVAIQGQTGLQLTINAATHLDQATYRIEATNLAGSVSSQGNLTVVLLTNGAQLYARDCASCHGNLNNSQKLNRTFDQIRNSMLTVPNMQNRFLVGNALNRTDAQIQAIANALLVVPPTITTQPVSQSRFVGQAVTFSVVASGTNLAYQWRFNGVNIANATNASYTINNVQAGNAGNYTVGISNTAGSVTSNIAVLTVTNPPVITTQPVSLARFVGQAATFSVVASGPNLNYQWRRNGINIAGATNASYTISSVQTTQAGNYSVMISNPAGSVTSNNAALTVNTAPTITTQPTNQTRFVGQAVTFSVVASGVNLTYQWRFNDVNIVGATNASYTINNVQEDNAGNYSVVVSNPAGSVTSEARVLTVYGPPRIPSLIPNQTIMAGQSVTFDAYAFGVSLTYQWRFNGVNIVGATNATYTVNNAQAGNAGNYSVVVSNPAGSVTSNNAPLTVIPTISFTTIPGPDSSVRSVSVSGSTICVVSSGRLLISTNGGLSFTERTTANGLVGAGFVNDVVISGTTVYAATLGGLAISTNGGVSFTNRTTANGLGSNLVHDVFVSGSTIYAGTDRGLSISTNGGTSFTNRNRDHGLGDSIIRRVFVSGSNVYVLTDRSLSISTNGGASFTNRPFSGHDIFVVGSTIYVGNNNGLYISTDGGTLLSNRRVGPGFSNEVRKILVVGPTIYLATANGLFISADDGRSFVSLNTTNGLENNFLNEIIMSGTRIYVGTSSGLSRSN